MKVCEKIKRLRQEKGWSQEEIANKLNISVNAYGSIERGETDVNLSRLEAVSEVLGIDMADLFDKKTSIFNNFGNVQTQTYQQNSYHQQNWCNIHQSLELLQTQHQLEKQQLLNAEKDKEIKLLKEIIELIKSKT